MGIAIGNLTIKSNLSPNDQILVQSDGVTYRSALKNLPSVLTTTLDPLSINGNLTVSGDAIIGGNSFNAVSTKINGVSTGATKTEASLINGNIKIDNSETTVYSLPVASNSLGGIKSGNSNNTGEVVVDNTGIASVNKVNEAVSAGTCTGNSATATKLANEVSVALTGECTGSVNSWDGSDNLSITTKLTGPVTSALSFSNNVEMSKTLTVNGNTTVDEHSTSGTLSVPNGGVYIGGGLKASSVYNAIWNDLVDSIEVGDEAELEYGYCYCFDGKKYHKSEKYLDDGIIGIHSDTSGFVMGSKNANKELKVSVAGFVLAYVDREYRPGTPLTCTCCGMLTEIHKQDKMEYPEKIVATYWKPEKEKIWGDNIRKVEVNGRHWVKIK